MTAFVPGFSRATPRFASLAQYSRHMPEPRV